MAVDAFNPYKLNVCQAYWFEVIDPFHRPTDRVRELLLDYAMQHPEKSADEWFKAIKADETCKADFIAYLQAHPLLPGEKSVKFLNQSQREICKANFVGGKIVQGKMENGEDWPLDTVAEFGKQRHYMAFVLDLDGNFYVNPHVKKTFHHSSFMAGADILCSGMIKIVDGKVKTINASSGHYKPKDENLALAVAYLTKHGVFVDDAHYKSKILPLRLFLTILDWMGLYDRGPQVSIVYRPPVLQKLASALLKKVNFAPIYWIGRGIEAIKVDMKFSLHAFNALYLNRFKEKENKFKRAVEELPASTEIAPIVSSEVKSTWLQQRPILKRIVKYAFWGLMIGIAAALIAVTVVASGGFAALLPAGLAAAATGGFISMTSSIAVGAGVSASVASGLAATVWALAVVGAGMVVGVTLLALRALGGLIIGGCRKGSSRSSVEQAESTHAVVKDTLLKQVPCTKARSLSVSVVSTPVPMFKRHASVGDLSAAKEKVDFMQLKTLVPGRASQSRR